MFGGCLPVDDAQPKILSAKHEGNLMDKRKEDARDVLVKSHNE